MTTTFSEKMDNTLDSLATAIFQMDRGMDADATISEASTGINDLRETMHSSPRTPEGALSLAGEMEDALHGGSIQELNESITQFNETLERYAAAQGSKVIATS